MTKQDKLLDRLKGATATFEWSDLVTLLQRLGYEKVEMAGSRVRFVHPHRRMILLHKPHSENVIKGGALKAVKATLSEEKLI